MSASDEPREATCCAQCGQYLSRCTCYEARKKWKADTAVRDSVLRLLTTENIPILAAVLAEVARLEAGHEYDTETLAATTDYEFRICTAANAVHEALRLRATAGGAP